jgi:hypothetical protein
VRFYHTDILSSGAYTFSVHSQNKKSARMESKLVFCHYDYKV